MQKLSSWGRLNATSHFIMSPHTIEDFFHIFKTYPHSIAHGQGRSYGDVCLNPNGAIWKMEKFDHFISFDQNNGILISEAGVSLEHIQKLVIPAGWMLPVTPGTQFITVGGAIANDVHGKNHHVFGNFGHHVKNIKLLRTNGEMIECGPDKRSDWFYATIGGVGLTGVILEAEIQLRPIQSEWIETEKIPYSTLNEFFMLADTSEAQWECTVSWIDCASKDFGRGIFIRGNHSLTEGFTKKSKQLKIPFTPPISLINQMSLKIFNQLYFHSQKKQSNGLIIHYKPFFYPLDHIHDWNKIYGPKGFFQYQCVVPRKNGEDAIRLMLKEIYKSGSGSFLAILKTFGHKKSLGMLSFPKPGITLALDFPNQGTKTYQLFDRLNHIVNEANGRIYLAKDSCMPTSLFEKGYPDLNEFLKYRDPNISSALSRRLMGW